MKLRLRTNHQKRIAAFFLCGLLLLTPRNVAPMAAILSPPDPKLFIEAAHLFIVISGLMISHQMAYEAERRQRKKRKEQSDDDHAHGVPWHWRSTLIGRIQATDAFHHSLADPADYMRTQIDRMIDKAAASIPHTPTYEEETPANTQPEKETPLPSAPPARKAEGDRHKPLRNPRLPIVPPTHAPSGAKSGGATSAGGIDITIPAESNTQGNGTRIHARRSSRPISPPSLATQNVEIPLSQGLNNILSNPGRAMELEHAYIQTMQAALDQIYSFPNHFTFEIRPHQPHPASERYAQQRAAEQRVDDILERELFSDTDKRFIYEVFFQRFHQSLFAAFSQAASAFKQQLAWHSLLELTWPGSLPHGGSVQRLCNNTKYDLQRLIYNDDGSPRVFNTKKQQENFARGCARAICNFILCFHPEYQAAVNAINQVNRVYDIPYLVDAFYEALDHAQSSDIVRTGRLFKNMFKEAFNFLSHDLWAGHPNLASNIANNLTARDLRRSLNFLLAGDFNNACGLADNYWNTPHYATFIESIKDHFFAMNTDYGVPRACQPDPLCMNLPQVKKNKFRNELNKPGRFIYREIIELQRLRATLIERWRQKQNLAQLLSIPRNHFPYVDHLLYKVMDLCKNGVDIPGIVQTFSHLSADSFYADEREAYSFFFNHYGICRFSGALDKSLLEGISFDKSIHHDKHKAVRQILNYLTTVATDTDEAREFVRQGYKYCSKALRDGDIGKAYTLLTQEWFAAGVDQHADETVLTCGDFAQDFTTAQQNTLRDTAVIQLASVLQAQKDLARDQAQPYFTQKNELLHMFIGQANAALESIAHNDLATAQALIDTIDLTTLSAFEAAVNEAVANTSACVMTPSVESMDCGANLPHSDTQEKPSGGSLPEVSIPVPGPDLIGLERTDGNDLKGCGSAQFLPDTENIEGGCNHSKGAHLPPLIDTPAHPRTTHDTPESTAPSLPSDDSTQAPPREHDIDSDNDDLPPGGGAIFQKPTEAPQAQDQPHAPSDTADQDAVEISSPAYTPATPTTLDGKLPTQEEKDKEIAEKLDKAIEEIAAARKLLKDFIENPNIPNAFKAPGIKALEEQLKQTEDHWAQKLLETDQKPTRPNAIDNVETPKNLDHTIDPEYAKAQAQKVKADIIDKVFENIRKPIQEIIPGASYYQLENGEIYRDIVPPERKPLSEENIAWAEKHYEAIRPMKDDVKKIAENTGLPEAVIQQIKNHVFINEHQKTLNFDRFEADPDIVSAWDRLYIGDFIKNDVEFLKHEYAESILMQETNIYDPFHRALNNNGLRWQPPQHKG